jgi:protein-tyrosine kinase
MKNYSEKNALRSEDYNALMQFDRTTGNILKYDQKTGQLDQFSRKIIRETNIIHRLIENGMILPGGWLTSKGLKEYENQKSRTKKTFSLKNGHQAKLEDSSDQEGLDGALSPQAEKFLYSLWNKNKVKTLKADQSVLQDEIVELKDEVSEKEHRAVINESSVKESETPTSTSKSFRLGNTEALYDEGAIDSNLISLLQPDSFEAEKFKILRTQIFFPLSGEVPRSIAVSSAVQGEGKSFVTANLAISIANDIDKHVLLIDCDLRKPKVHELFGFKDDLPGLSEYLSGKMELPSLLLQTKVEKLTILPAGALPANPSELLSSDRMHKMLTEVSERYDDRMIILDTTPLSMTAEASVLIRLVDGILLVVRQGYTPKELLRDLIKKIGNEKIIGTVFNDVDMRSLAQHEYRKYHKSYYYNKEKNSN